MSRIENRKADHINICLTKNVTPGYRYWDDIKLIHEALPEVDYDEIDTTVNVLGKELSFPLIINAITGGFKGAEEINSNIAEACADMGVGMGVGSERAAIEGTNLRSYEVVKDYDVPLMIGNVGAPQLIRQKKKDAFTDDDIARAMDAVDADYMAIHLNYLQEAVQPEGDMNSKGCFDRIRDLARKFPIIAKETGAGITPFTAKVLGSVGVEAIDIGGMGGTSFAAIEMYREMEADDSIKCRLGSTFFDWGIPSTVCLETMESEVPVIASGGITTGLDIARAIAMGACCAGASMAVLEAATESPDAVKEVISMMKAEFKTAMMLTGCSDVSELRNADYIILGETKQWLEDLE